MKTHRTQNTSRRQTRSGSGRIASRLRHGAAIVAAGLMLTGTPVVAADFKDAVVQQLVEQGFREFRISRTLLGRTRVVATSKTLRREIIFNPVTGEILRDHWRDKDESPKLFRRANNEAGEREPRAPVLADPATVPTATAAIAPKNDESGQGDDADAGDQDAAASAATPDTDTSGADDNDTSVSSDGANTDAPDTSDAGDSGDATGGDSDAGETGGDTGGADSGGEAESGAGGDAEGSESGGADADATSG